MGTWAQSPPKNFPAATAGCSESEKSGAADRQWQVEVLGRVVRLALPLLVLGAVGLGRLGRLARRLRGGVQLILAVVLRGRGGPPAHEPV
jgi:hypothetical protein